MAEQASYVYDFFISYSPADYAWVDGYLLDALTQAGLRCHTAEAFELGAPLIAEFERAILQSRRTLLVLSPAYRADDLNPFVDLLAQSLGVETATWPVIPILLQQVDLPPRLAMLYKLDATDPASWPEMIERLVADVSHPVPAAPAPPQCPYPGMLAFKEADHSRFFGREAEVKELVECLRLHPFLTVIGRSGSGKSSLIFAGLLPALRASRRFGPGEWTVRDMRPAATPLTTLQEKISDVVAWATFQRIDAGEDRLLLIVDQFEEVFTQRTPEAVSFQSALARLAGVPGCFIVLTVRSDFFGDLQICPLWSRIKDHRFDVLPLDAAGLRQAIVRPAEAARVYVEAALVERLVAEAAGEPGVLPFVQETLALLWEHLERRLLPLRAYEALVLSSKAYGGAPRTGLQVAMARHADAALAALPEAQQVIARRIFLRLVQFGEGRADTRRQQPVVALRADAPPDAFEATLQHLVGWRLLTLTGGEAQDRLADLAHEALIGGWPTLARWVSEQREAELTRRRLEGKATEWVRLGRGQGGLLDEIALAEAERWLEGPDRVDTENDPLILELVRSSKQALQDARRAMELAQQRELQLERRARRRTQMVLALVSALLLVGFGYVARQEWLRYWAARLGETRPVAGLPVRFERFEVTNQRYALCVEAGRCVPPPPQLSTFFAGGNENSPIVGVDALQAHTFCAWIKRRLPTAAEWTLAAHQDVTIPWPLGEPGPITDYANLLDDNSVQDSCVPEDVGRRRGTSEGLHDLVGNAAEWTSTIWPETSDRYPVSVWDGSAKNLPEMLEVVGGGCLATVSSFSAPVETMTSFRYFDIGFRCVESRKQ